jgi:hypothetical protein
MKVADIESQDTSHGIYLHYGNQMRIVGLLSDYMLREYNALPGLENLGGGW